MARRSGSRQKGGEDAETLGVQLGRARQARKVGQGELARLLEISAPNLSRIENGADFRVSTLIELARALKLEPLLVPKEYVPAVRAIIDPERSDDAAPPERGRFT